MSLMQRSRPTPDDTLVGRTRFTRRRLWARWRRVVYALLVVALAALVTWLVWFSSALTVREVEVRGVEFLTADEVRNTAAATMEIPLARADLDPLQARVEALAAVKAVTVRRDWPRSLVIDVTERESLAAVQWEGTWRAVDADGVLFRTYSDPPSDLPQLRISSTTTIDALAEAAAVVDGLPRDLQERVRYLQVGSIDDIEMSLDNPGTAPIRVRWGSAEDTADKARVLAVLLEAHAQDEPPIAVYDVTAPGRPTIAPVAR